MKRLALMCGAANLGRSRLLAGSGRLKGGCGHDCPPHYILRTAVALFLAAANGWAQCVMCYRTAAAQNAARAHLLNMGIVLLGLPPFCILGGFLILAWRRNQAYAATPETQAAPNHDL
jgi:hypothetical protein